MSVRESNIVIVIAFFALSRFCDSQTVCKGGDNNACRCDLVNGKGVIDLSFGSKEPSKPLFSGIPSEDGTSTYSYNPCYKFTSPDDQIQGLAVLSFEADISYYADIGQQSTAQFIYGQNEGISVMYSSSDNLTFTIVVLSCRQSGTNEVAANNNPVDSNYKFTLTGPGTCPAQSSSGLSGGSIFLILFSVTIVIYIVGGVIYQKKKNNATGTDAIPNKDFWLSLPGLIKDGAVFLFYKCRCKSPPDVEYQSI